MFQRILLTAMVAGVLAGLCAFGVQRLRTIPLISQAEVHEAAAEQSAQAHAGHAHGGAAEAKAWEPEDGLERNFFTLLADVLAGVGFALLVTGAMALARLRGHEVDLRRGLLWGAAGFAAFALAPALGLPPELPGTESAALGLRQLWWVATAIATAGGLAMLFFARALSYRVAGIALLLLPHLIGAPHPVEHGASAPPELMAQFVIASLMTAGLFWLVLGGTSGWLYRRLG